MSRKDDILKIREVLVKRSHFLRKALAGDLALLKELRPQTTGDLVDGALDSIQDDIASRMAEVESRELKRIEYALQLMCRGTYGICEECEIEIPITRLRALPCATLCIRCQNGAEMLSTLQIFD